MSNVTDETNFIDEGAEVKKKMWIKIRKRFIKV